MDYRWYIRPDNGKAATAVDEFTETFLGEYISVIEVRSGKKRWEVHGLREVSLSFLNEIHHRRLAEEYAFQAFRRRGKAPFVELWDFPFSQKKKIRRKVKKAIAKIKPDTGKAIKI